MLRLNPPYLSSTIPAFFGDTLYIVFEHNKTVSPASVAGMVVTIKDLNNSLIAKSQNASYNLTTGELSAIKFIDAFSNPMELSKILTVGSFYKI